MASSRPPPLISVAELAEVAGRPDHRLCDVRWYLGEPDRGRREYEAGHLPGAVFVDLESDLVGETGPGRHPLPSPADFAATLGRLGIGPDTTVVAYDAAGGATAARLWWMLGAIDHAGRRVLDGGIGAWQAAGRPLTTDVPHPDPVPYPTPAGWKGVVDVEGVRRRIGFATLIDARTAERYRGEVEPIDPRPGHIPTAVSLPYPGNLGEDGRMLPPEALAERYREAGGETVVYCGSGVTACHAALAMAVAGRRDPLLYAGSWSDWSSRPELPAAVGDR